MLGRKRIYGGKQRRAKSQPSRPTKKAKSEKALTSKAITPNRTIRSSLIYGEIITLNAGVSGVTESYVFSANGLFDPNVSGSGHQPTGFDQMMALYREYVVLASKIIVSICSQDTNGWSGTFGVSCIQESGTSTDYRRYLQAGSTVWGKQSGRTAEPLKLINYVDIAKHENQDIFQDDTYRGTSSANPNDQLYWHIWMQPDGFVDTGNYFVTVQIIYDTVFREPIFTDIS